MLRWLLPRGRGDQLDGAVGSEFLLWQVRKLLPVEADALGETSRVSKVRQGYHTWSCAACSIGLVSGILVSRAAIKEALNSH